MVHLMIKSNKLEKNKTKYLSRDGREFDIDSDSWRLNKNTLISVGWTEILDSAIATSLIKVLARCAEEYAAETVFGLNAECRCYVKKMKVSQFDIHNLVSYRASLKKNEEHRLAKVRMLLKNWFDWGYSGVNEELIKQINSWRLKGAEKGKAVKSLDVREGPLTEIEMSSLIEVMLETYVSGQLSLTHYSIASLLAFTGRRPIQITSLKVKDICEEKAGEATNYWINFPRAKQRFSKWRSEFNDYPITQDLWILLSLHANNVIKKIKGMVPFILDGEMISECPLFPDYKAIRECKEKTDFLVASSTDYLHIERDYCAQVMKRLETKLDVYSERTGKRLNLSTRRFRYTLGSNIAREGKGELIIAEALDHSDTQNVGVYVKNLPDVVERIDKAVALQLAPLAQAFQGVLIDSESDAERGNDSTSRIGNGEVSVGNCGSYGFCNALAPIACYTCKHFQPWIDGPHEMILNELLEKRNEVLKNTEDIKIASSNDRLILAVGEVIRRCNDEKSKRLLTDD